MTLNLEPLQQAVITLEEAIRLHAEHSSEVILKRALRDSAIKRFEYTYELAWKLMQRWLANNVSPESAEPVYTRKELFRLAANHGLIDDPLKWFAYHQARNLSAHTYNEIKATEVFKAASKLATDARILFDKLGQHND